MRRFQPAEGARGVNRRKRRREAPGDVTSGRGKAGGEDEEGGEFGEAVL